MSREQEQTRTVNYQFYHDPGHGWLKVPAADLVSLGIAGQVSEFSYMSQNCAFAFLEEDCDQTRFLEAAKVAGWSVQVPASDAIYHEDERVRSLPSYDSVQICRVGQIKNSRKNARQNARGASPYCWCTSDNRVSGPSDAALTVEQIKSHPDAEEWRARDGDGHTVASGFMIEIRPNECEGFEPLDDFARPAMGAVEIQYRSGGEWKTL